MSPRDFVAEWFQIGHLRPDLRDIAAVFRSSANFVVDQTDWQANPLSEDQQLDCLRHLLKAKDCAVRAAVVANRASH